MPSSIGTRKRTGTMTTTHSPPSKKMKKPGSPSRAKKVKKNTGKQCAAAKGHDSDGSQGQKNANRKKGKKSAQAAATLDADAFEEVADEIDPDAEVVKPEETDSEAELEDLMSSWSFVYYAFYKPKPKIEYVDGRCVHSFKYLLIRQKLVEI
ncbi:hypothetical protein C8T65DRAFT_751108 [Cerioporus squamosus]|nr:hypothetical protein C8T65DRAFT_751108 [Cerioporus squamosus]